MDMSQQKEDISISYISALCASAGISYDVQQHDDDSTDAIIKRRIVFDDGSFYDAQMRIQLKCTSSVSQYTNQPEVISYKLKVKNYNDLCTPSTMPIILGLLVLPEDETEWVSWSKEELLIKGCMYWNSFLGCVKSDNQSTVTVQIPKCNLINQDSLNFLLEKIAKEERL